MKKMYRSSIWETTIKEVEGTVDTGSIIYFECYRRKQEPIQTECYKWHESKEQALESTKQYLLIKISEIEEKLSKAKKRLEDFENSHK